MIIECLKISACVLISTATVCVAVKLLAEAVRVILHCINAIKRNNT